MSKASAKQRRGRAGRTQAGFCWRLFTRGTFASFPDASPPEIQRVPLEGLCLQVQLQRMSGGVAGFLSRALQAPEPEAVSGAIRNLVRIGALTEKENLTPLGHILVRAPFLSVDIANGGLFPSSLPVPVLLHMFSIFP